MIKIHETSSRFASRFLFGLLLFAAGSVVVAQGERRPLTLEWIFGEGRTVASVPATTWLDDGSLIILDNRKASRERTFERLNPATGRRVPLVDAARTLADLKSVAGVEADALPWPIAFDGAGRRALYIFKGDVFTLELDESRIFSDSHQPLRKKHLPASLQTARRIAYVRDHDLYFFDLDSNRETRITRDGSETLLNGTLSWVYWEEVFGRRDIGYWWAPDSEAIAYLQSDESTGRSCLLHRYHAFPAPRYSAAICQSRRQQSASAAGNC